MKLSIILSGIISFKIILSECFRWKHEQSPFLTLNLLIILLRLLYLLLLISILLIHISDYL